MSEKSKLYVFEKKEVALIFVFMLLIAITSFMLGVKIGKSYSFQSSGLSEEDRQKVELLSAQEETVNEVIKKDKSKNLPEEQLQNELREEMHKKLQDKVREGLQGQEQSSKPQAEPSKESSSTQKSDKADIIDNYQDRSQSSSSEVKPNQEQETSKKKASEQQEKAFKGKYTIQLGSYRTRKDAEKFARGFTIRGYDPIINEVEIPGRGTWFRVSLGVFNSSTQAKKYIKKEEELFQGQDYVIGRFD